MSNISFGERMRIPDYSNPDHVSHGTIRFDYSICTACFLCRAACPANAITIQDDKPFFADDESECIFCGNCLAICLRGVISLDRAYKYSFIYKTIDHLPAKPPKKDCIYKKLPHTKALG